MINRCRKSIFKKTITIKKTLQFETTSKIPHLIKDSHEWPIVDITKNGKILNVYLLRLEKMQAIPLSPLP